jgi:hypothetical protein
MKDDSIHTQRGFYGWLGALALSVGLVTLAPAAPANAQDAAPPARAVRLSSVEGRVQIVQGDQIVADPAVANAPLFEGTQIVTQDDGRAEVQFEEGSIARLSPDSAFTLTVLRPQDGVGGTEIRMDGGLGYFELQPGNEPGHIQVRFGDAVVTSSGFTVLRVNMDNAPGELAVFSGNAHLERGSDVSIDLHGGESVAFSAADGQYNIAETIQPDSWDSWNSDRDQVLNAENSSRTPATGSFVNSANPAWSDLDANGNWYDVPGQGYVWSPYEAASPGWDPYGNGYWMWSPGFGYTWVSGDSWGYMPYNCGSWSFFSGFGWGWSPGVGPCMPWWGGGLYVINIVNPPFGYLPPRMPRRPPVRAPVKPGGRVGPIPMIAVNRHAAGNGASLPARDRSTPVTIAGHVVTPIRPLSPRPHYQRVITSYGIHPSPAAAGAVTQSGATNSAVSRPSFTASKPAATATQAKSASSGQHPSSHASAPAPHYSSGGGGAPHVSSGGGGGGSSPHH